MFGNNSANLYFRSSDIAFLTKHKKELIVAPVLEPFLCVKIVQVEGVDTDTFGTFTGEIPRKISQLETARKKARTGMELARTKMGIGSEGSFVTDPHFGVLPWNIEMLVFLDDIHNLEIVGMAEGPARILEKSARSLEEAMGCAEEFGFPRYHMIVRPDSKDSPDFIKNIRTKKQLQTAISHCLEKSRNGVVHIENDLRSFACPSRQDMIRLAAINLLLKMHSFCPQCDTPGYWVMEYKKGLPCRNCQLPTGLARAQVYGCLKCGYKKEVERSDIQSAGPESCSFCNP